MRKTITCLILLCLFLIPLTGENLFRVMFYNTENFFDTQRDTLKNDADFTPEGSRYWTKSRYYRKANNLAKVITAAGEWNYPVLIGLCEVENVTVMETLTRYSALKNQGYKYVMPESSDRRGINLALMYQRDEFKVLEKKDHRISFPDNPAKRTRDILHVTGITTSRDTLDIFVCHFPSRRGGEKLSEPDRIRAAEVLKEKTDSVVAIRRDARLIIMGDFNDEPSSKSLSKVLQAVPAGDSIRNNSLYNLFYSFEKQGNTGSYKYGKVWNVIDQIIVSGNLLNPDGKFYVLPQTATVYSPEFILIKDKTHGGKRPRKTYSGFRYEGGYSDHLPVFVDFCLTLPE